METDRERRTRSEEVLTAVVTSDYVIVIDGELDEPHRLELRPLEISLGGGRSTLVARSVDQPALHGILARLADLGVTLISVAAGETTPTG